MLDHNHDGSLSREEFQQLTHGLDSHPHPGVEGGDHRPPMNHAQGPGRAFHRPEMMRRMHPPQRPPIHGRFQQHRGPWRDGVSDGGRNEQRAHKAIGRREHHRRPETKDRAHRKSDRDDDDDDDDDEHGDHGDDKDGDADEISEERSEAPEQGKRETTQLQKDVHGSDWI